MTKTLLKKINNLLIERRNNQATNNRGSVNIYKMGIFLPTKADKSEVKSDLVVGFLINEISCFNTKKRVPYKIVLECIDYKEFKTSKIKLSKDKIMKITDSELKEIEKFDKKNIWQVKKEVGQNVSSSKDKFFGFDAFAEQKMKQEKEFEDFYSKSSFISRKRIDTMSNFMVMLGTTKKNSNSNSITSMHNKKAKNL